MQRSQRRSPVLFLLALLAVFWTFAAWAQHPAGLPLAGDPTPMSGRPPPQSVTDDQLRRFADAARKVSVISQEYAPRMQAQPREAQPGLQREADDKMVEAVHDSGLSVDEFNGIGQAIQDDPGLRQRVRQLLPQ